MRLVKSVGMGLSRWKRFRWLEQRWRQLEKRHQGWRGGLSRALVRLGVRAFVSNRKARDLESR